MEALRRKFDMRRLPHEPRVRALALLALAALVAGVVVGLTSGGHKRLVPGGGNRDGTYDPLAYDPGRRAEFERNAAAGLSHVLYAKSPGGAVATAARVARFRPLVVAAAKRGRVDPDLLEAIVFLESAGRPDAIAGGDPESATGLTQILAETGANLLGMHVNLPASRRLTKKIARAEAAGRARRVRRLVAARRRVDDRFDPRKALAGTVRYLGISRKRFGRADLAIESYHMGIGNLETALRRYAGDTSKAIADVVAGKDLTYARLYFDSTPLVHPRAYRLLAALGDDSATYYWRVLAARSVMRLYRTNLPELNRLSGLQNARSNAEELLHPPGETRAFENPAALRRAYAAGVLRRLPSDPPRYGFRVDPGMGTLARRAGGARSLYRGLRPEALALLAYMGSGTRAIAGGTGSLIVTSSTRDRAYQRLLMARTIQATHGYSLHTTGYAFDIARLYASRRQALAFQFMLDRLTALNLIAWAREPSAIHVTVSSRAKALEPALAKLGG